MGVADYLVGRRVYRAASNAPTRGPVDPMGYINRSLASPVGGDGLSDRRSGLAQAALARMRNNGRHLGLGHMPISIMPPPPAQPFPPMPQPTMQQQLGYSVSPTGQLLANTPYPYDNTAQALNGMPQQPQTVSEPQLMEAARNRLSHQIQMKEMLTKHQHAIQQMNMRAAEAINRHRKAARL